MVNRSIPDDPPKVESLHLIPLHLAAPVDALIAQLDRSVMLHVRDIPRREQVYIRARLSDQY